MGTASRFLYTQQQSGMTLAQYIENGNGLFSVIAESGMQQVDYSIIPGQCDRMVATLEAAVNENDKVVALKNPTTWVAQENTQVLAFKVFKHPVLNFYLKVDVCETGGSGDLRYAALTVTYHYANDINANGELINPAVLRPRSRSYGWQGVNSDYAQGYRIGRQLNVSVSCGKDHFVLGHTSDLLSYDHSQALASGANIAMNCNNPRGGFSTLAIAIFQLSDPNYRLLMIPKKMNENSSYPMEFAASDMDGSNMGLPQKWLNDTRTGATIYLGGGPNLSTVAEVGTISDAQGVRVYQATMTVDSQLVTVPLGCIHAGAVDDMGVVTLNLDGNGDRKYFITHAFGTCTFVTARVLMEKVPVFLFPWGD